MEFLARIQFSHLFFIFFITTNASIMAMEKKAPEYLTYEKIPKLLDDLVKNLKEAEKTNDLSEIKKITKQSKILGYALQGDSAPYAIRENTISLQSYLDATAYNEKLMGDDVYSKSALGNTAIGW